MGGSSAWTATEDSILVNYIQAHGEGHWRSLPKKAGLLTCDKSCRLRWMNNLRPGIKRGNIPPDEDDLIIRLHALLGNRWSLIAGRLPGRTDNEIKNYCNTHLRKRQTANNTNCMTEAGGKESGSKTETINNASEETTKTKVHLPKATRVSTASVSNFPNGCNSSCQNYVATDVTTLDEVVEEYQQLFKEDSHSQLDSFLYSLWA